ncbi:MAG TPA: hypothetical protein VE258_09445 [Ktedonobacterales bacterium]|nr:hypothetical protein [Ktedonobacterales bacterium]
MRTASRSVAPALAAKNPKVRTYYSQADYTQRDDVRLIDGTAPRASSGGSVR